jgi:hypothetical protein
VNRRRTLIPALALLVLLVAPTTAAQSVGKGVSGVPAAQLGKATAVQELGACLAASRQGDLLLLVDQSGSLQQTDPGAVRVRAAGYLLGQLLRATGRAGAQLDVAVSGFDAAYAPVVNWQRLTDASLPGLTKDLQQFASRNDGLDTDYVNAMAGARDQLRQKANSGPRCQAILWFTDGQFDVAPRTSQTSRARYGTTKSYAPDIQLTDEAGAAAAELAGRTTLCRAGGVADQLRASHVLTLAIGLGTAKGDFGFMRSIATGNDPTAGPCGRATEATVGDFRLASNVDDLLFALDAVADPAQAPTTTESQICQRTACDSQAHSFVLDLSVRNVHVLAGADRPGIRVVLKPPGAVGGATFSYNGGAVVPALKVGQQQVTVRWLTDRTLDLSLSRQSEAQWTGQWSVVFVDPAGASKGARARTQIRITGDLVPALAKRASPQLRSGGPASMQLRLVSEVTGATVDSAQVLGQGTVSAELLPAGGRTLPIAQDVAVRDLGKPVGFDLTAVTPGAATLRLTLRLRTANVPAAGARPVVAGTQLADRLVSVPVTVLPPLHYPTTASRVDFGRAEGVTPAHTVLKATGPGCVWVDGTVVQASPDGVGNVTVTAGNNTQATCVKLSAGQTRDIPLQLDVAKPGTGTVAGTITAHLAPLDAGNRVLTTPVSFLGDLVKPVDSSVRMAVFLLALLLGLGLPVAFLYLAKWWTARIPGQALLAGCIPVQLVNGVVLRDGTAFTVSHNDLSSVPIDRRGTRSLTVPNGLRLQTRSGMNPSSTAFTRVLAEGDAVVTSQGNGELPLAIHNTWVARLTDLAGGRGQVTVLLSANVGPEVYARVIDEVARNLPEGVERLRKAAEAKGILPETPPADPGTSWGGGRPPPSSPTGGTWDAPSDQTSRIPDPERSGGW